MRLSRDFKEFIECLNASSSRYIVIGGYAVAWHGHPRYTKDIDIWLEPGMENGARVVNALKLFGFESLGLQPHDFAKPDAIIQIGYPPLRIDLLTSAAGLDFRQCHARSELAEVDGITARILALVDLRTNKLAVGRAQDLADVESLSE